MMLRRGLLALLASSLVACGDSGTQPGNTIAANFELSTIDGMEPGVAISDAGSTVLVEVFDAWVGLNPDLTCSMRRMISELDKSDPVDWVQTLNDEFAYCTYVVSNDAITITVSAVGGGSTVSGPTSTVAAERTFLFPNGGSITGRLSDPDPYTSGHEFQTLTLTEDGRVYVYETPTGGGGGGWCLIC